MFIIIQNKKKKDKPATSLPKGRGLAGLN